MTLQPITLSPKQRQLLGVSEDDPLFRNEVPPQQKVLEQNPSINLSCINLHRRSAIGSPMLNETSMQIISNKLISLIYAE